MSESTGLSQEEGSIVLKSTIVALERNKKRVAELEKEVEKESSKRKEMQAKLNKALARVDELKGLSKNLPGKGEVVVKEAALKEIIAAMWTGKANRLSKKYVANHVMRLFGMETPEEAMRLVRELMNY